MVATVGVRDGNGFHLRWLGGAASSAFTCPAFMGSAFIGPAFICRGRRV